MRDAQVVQASCLQSMQGPAIVERTGEIDKSCGAIAATRYAEHRRTILAPSTKRRQGAIIGIKHAAPRFRKCLGYRLSESFDMRSYHRLVISRYGNQPNLIRGQH